MLVLGVETTCDETAAAVVRRDRDGRGVILSNSSGVDRLPLFEHFGKIEIDMPPAGVGLPAAGRHLFTLFQAMGLHRSQRSGHDLNLRGADEVDTAAKQGVEIARHHGPAVAAQQHGTAVA